MKHNDFSFLMQVLDGFIKIFKIPKFWLCSGNFGAPNFLKFVYYMNGLILHQLNRFAPKKLKNRKLLHFLPHKMAIFAHFWAFFRAYLLYEKCSEFNSTHFWGHHFFARKLGFLVDFLPLTWGVAGHSRGTFMSGHSRAIIKVQLLSHSLMDTAEIFSAYKGSIALPSNRVSAGSATVAIITFL